MIGQATLWYGLCSYWTEDWSKVASAPGVPCCPNCGSPGFVTEVAQWWADVDRYQADGHPGYHAFVESLREQCFGREPGVLMTNYEEYRLRHGL